MAGLYDTFREAPPGRQVAIFAGVSIVILLIVGSLWFLLLRTGYEAAFSDLQPADATVIVGQLEKEKIPYRLAQGGTQVLVPEESVDVARVKVMGADLPFRGTVGLELFAKSDMGMTDFAQKINYQRALQGELVRTIMAIDGVDTARVHLALGEDRVFRNDRVPPKASIMVRMRGNATVPASTADGIRRLVAAAIDQLEPASVVVLDERGTILAAPSSFADAGVGVSPAVAARQAIEDWYVARVRQAISGIAVGTIEVGVNAGSGGGDALEAGLPTGDGTRRSFPITVTLTPREDISSEVLEHLRASVREAIGFDLTRGDSIVISPARPVMPVTGTDTLVPDLGGVSRNAVSDVDRSSEIALSSIILFGIGAVVVMLAGMVLVRGRRRRAALKTGSPAFADRLNSLLHDDVERQRHGSN